MAECVLELWEVDGAAAVAIDAAHDERLIVIGEDHTEALQCLTGGSERQVERAHIRWYLPQLIEVECTRAVAVKLVEHGLVLVVAVCVLNLLEALLHGEGGSAGRLMMNVVPCT